MHWFIELSLVCLAILLLCVMLASLQWFWEFFVCAVLISLSASFCAAADPAYEGRWVNTEGRRIDGRMTAVVKDLGGEKWQARFFGRWQGVDFDYTVKFAGPRDKLKGKAVIDGARYDWEGRLDDESFLGSYTGDRYTGKFDLLRK